MSTPMQEKKSALTARLATLDADEQRIKDKRKATQDQLKALDVKAAAPAKPAKAEKAKK